MTTMDRLPRLLAVTAALAPSAAALGQDTSAPSYIRSVSPMTQQIIPLLTTGDSVDGYRMVGIPDGLGAYNTGGQTFRLYCNHELGQTNGVARAHGGTGAFVSEWEIEIGGSPSTPTFEFQYGQDAISTVHDYNDVTGQYQVVSNGRFNRLCSAHLSGPTQGIRAFLTGEETSNNQTLDGVIGGQSFAVIDGTAYALPRLGRFAKENQVILEKTGLNTVVIVLDDTTPSQLFVYVGRKNPAALANPLSQLGLDNGDLYVLKVDGLTSENQLVKGQPREFSMQRVDWWLNEPGLRAQTAAAGAFNFIRIEDGAQDLRDRDTFYFVTTGGPGTGNTNGRLHAVKFHRAFQPELGGTIEVLLDGSEGIISPDNIDINVHGQIMIQEDPTFTLSGRDSSMWCYNAYSTNLTRVIEMDSAVAAARDNAYSLGKWETSGVIDASHLLGKGWWLLDVQAHYNLADPELVQDGQILAVKVAVD